MVTSPEHYPPLLGIPWMQLHDVRICFVSNSLTFGYQYCQFCCSPHPATLLVAEGISTPLPERPILPKFNVAKISTVAMKLLSKTSKPVALTLYEINQAIKVETTKAVWKKSIPAEYHDFLDLFDKKLA